MQRLQSSRKSVQPDALAIFTDHVAEQEIMRQILAPEPAAGLGKRALPARLRRDTGRVIYLNELAQWRTYGCRLEGIPRKEMNGQLVIEAEAHARKKISLSGPNHIIPTARESLSLSENRRVTTGGNTSGYQVRKLRRLSALSPLRINVFQHRQVLSYA